MGAALLRLALILPISLLYQFPHSLMIDTMTNQPPLSAGVAIYSP
jgi:hypothetical protein